MNRTRLLYHLARADFLERVRRFSFLITMLACLFAAYGFLPANNADYVTLQMGSHRGVYNSPYVGTLVAMLTGIFLSLAGFYVVKNTIERDRATGVGQILATTPVSRFFYILGKTASNLAVLGAMAGVVAVASVGMQLLRREDTHLQWGAIFLPFLLLTLPCLAVVAAVAVLFETIPGLRGGAGNVIYFFVWTFSLAAGLGPSARAVASNDLTGAGIAVPILMRACQAAFPDFDPAAGHISMGVNLRPAGEWDLTTFTWDGIAWTGEIVVWRLTWVAVAVGFAFAASLLFDRFDSSRRQGAQTVRQRRWWKRGPAAAPESEALAGAPGTELAGSPAHLTPLAASEVSAGWRRFARMLRAELRIMARGLRVWWLLVLAGLTIAAIANPLETARLRLLPVLWIWPVLVWSAMGSRETRFGTDQILFSTPHPVRVHLLATWLAGAVFAMLTGGVIGARLLLAGDYGAVLGWLAGAAFIPSLALAMGVWTGGSRLFEAVYTIFWYLGPLQPTPALDFMGVSAEAIRRGMPAIYALAAGVLLLLAMEGRRRRIRT